MSDKTIYDSSDLLNYAVQTGIISLDTMLNDIEAMERKELLEQHPYAITVTTEKSGKEIFSTYLPSPDGNRLFRRRNTREELYEEVILSFYKALQEEIYIENVFYEWIDRKLEFCEIQKASYDRYVNDYKRFFKNGIRTLIRGIFKYAKKKKYTSISITEFFGDLELPNNLFKRRIIDKQKEVFMENEIPLVIDYLKSKPGIYNLGILLTFQTGLRVGELSTLKPQDLFSRIIKIRRTEDKYRDDNNKWVVTVKEHAKTDAGNRDLIISTTAQETLDKILALNPAGEYLFEHGG